jgi:glycerol kinase
MYLAIDLGTTGCRSMLVDQNSEIVAVEYEEYGLITPKEGYVEQNAENWWEMTLRTAAKAMKQAGIIYATDQIIDLFANGIKNVHVYSMNKPDVAQQILTNLSSVLN